MKLLKTTLACLIFTAIFSSQTYAQNHYSVTIKLDGLNDSLILMASYIGDKQFIVDTAYYNKQGTYHFQGDSLLPDGMYTIANSKKTKLFDFIVSGKENVSIIGNKENLPLSLKSKENDENRILFDYINYLADKQKEQKQLQQLKKQFKAGSDSIKIVNNKIEMLNEEVDRHIKGIINTNQGKFISVFLKSMQDPEIPDPPILSNGHPDSVFAFHQYRKHFWDNINLSDDRVIRTPIIHSKVEQYLNKMTAPAPDSIIVAIDHLFQMVDVNQITFKYLMWYLTVKYESSEIMGHDAVFVHLVDKYYSDPKMSWMNATVKQNLINRANTLRPILIGKTAPDLILLDTLQNPVSLKAIKSKYTIIYFWDPECSHCKKETPVLKSFYDEASKKYNLQIYAVCMDTSWKNMKAYILKNKMNWINVNGYYSMSGDFRELYDVHSSPIMYLLDENKKIIAKRILTEQMKEILKKVSEGTLKSK